MKIRKVKELELTGECVSVTGLCGPGGFNAVGMW